MDNNVLLWLWLKIAVRDKNLEAYKLYRHYGSIEKIYALTLDDLAQIDFVSVDTKEALLNKKTDHATSILKMCQSNKIDILTVNDARYPSQLLEIYNYPCILFVYGDYEEAFSKPMIAIVGTRDCTSYGIRTAAKITEVLGYAGFTIVTGVAKGIDSSAINAATGMDASVIAVLPSGIANATLSSSYKFKDVRKNGAIISEYLPSFKTHPYVYQERNRILAGLCIGSVIIQAPKKSGALMTATYSLNQNRDVFALPGNIDMPQSEGSNRLLKDGAIPIITLKDIVDYYKPLLGDKINDDIPDYLLQFPSPIQVDEQVEEQVYDFKQKIMGSLDENEMLIMSILHSGATDINTIIEKSELHLSIVMSTLTSLEAKGAVVSDIGNNFKIKI